MPTYLEKIRSKFDQRLKVVDSAFERHIVSPRLHFTFDRFALQEGLLSSLWQYWCLFCREVLLASAAGAVTSSGQTTSSHYSNRSETEVAYVCKRLIKQQPTTPIRQLAGRHLEPTWGDLNSLNTIPTGLHLSNAPELLSAFGGLMLVRDLQDCRNACAHLNGQTMATIRTARVRYLQTNFRHPSEMMFWVDPSTSDFLWKSWIDEMSLAAIFAVT